MNVQLFVKIIAGPRKALLVAAQEEATGEIADVVDQIVRSLNEVGLTPNRAKLRLLLRRFGPDRIWADGHFDDRDGSYGYFMYGPAHAQPAAIDEFLYHTLNPRLFYQAHIEGSADCLFTGLGMPSDPELPWFQTVVWCGPRLVASLISPRQIAIGLEGGIKRFSRSRVVGGRGDRLGERVKHHRHQTIRAQSDRCKKHRFYLGRICKELTVLT